jgi:hypothetical protein
MTFSYFAPLNNALMGCFLSLAQSRKCVSKVCGGEEKAWKNIIHSDNEQQR